MLPGYVLKQQNQGYRAWYYIHLRRGYIYIHKYMNIQTYVWLYTFFPVFAKGNTKKIKEKNPPEAGIRKHSCPQNDMRRR